MPCGHSPLKMRTPFGERRWFSGQSACLLAARLGTIEQASQRLFIKKEICHPGSLNTLQRVPTGRVCDTFGPWKPPKLYGGCVKRAPDPKRWPHLILDVDVLDGVNNIAVATDRLVAPNDIKMVAHARDLLTFCMWTHTIAPRFSHLV